MPDFGPYAFYIAGAYAVAGLSIAALLFATLCDLRVLKNELDKNEP